MSSSSLPRHRVVEHVLGAEEKCLVTAESFQVSRRRRALDVVVAPVLLVVCLPVLAVAALWTLAARVRPVLVKERRIGEAERPFELVTLRAAGVGGIPHLWHVLRGQMTLVGPQPESLDRADSYPESCRLLLSARPGLTSPGQQAYGDGAAGPPQGWPNRESWYLEVLVPLRADADLEFLTHPTLWRTVRCLAVAVLAALRIVRPRRTVVGPAIPTQRQPGQSGNQERSGQSSQEGDESVAG
jgi:lipopolysaccharide/colanic/teichoic acid biosynthesis glycosyltransferase